MTRDARAALELRAAAARRRRTSASPRRAARTRRRAGRRSCARSASRRRGTRRSARRRGAAARNRSRSTPQSTTSVLPRASGTFASSSRAQVVGDGDDRRGAARRRSASAAPIPGIAPRCATSWPCAVTTSGAPTGERGDQPGRERGSARTRRRAGSGAMRARRARELEVAAACRRRAGRARRARPRGRARRAAPRAAHEDAEVGIAGPRVHLRDEQDRALGGYGLSVPCSSPSPSSTSPSLRRSSRCPSARRACARPLKSLVRRKTREVRAVDGISFEIGAGRGRRLPRPERRRQDDDAEDALRPPLPDLAARRACSVTSRRGASATTCARSRS